MKRLWITGMLCLSAFALTACGSTNDSVSSASNPQESSIQTESASVSSVEEQEITITWDTWDYSKAVIISITRTGTYTGELVDGVPNGKGIFTSTNDAGEPWSYTGDFKDGVFHGYGVASWENSDAFEAGKYVNGVFTPDTLDLLVTLSSYSNGAIELSENTMTFIGENLDIFPVLTDEANEKAAEFVNDELSYKMLEKSIASYEGQLIHSDAAEVTQIEEISLYGHTLTTMILRDAEYNFYVMYYDGALPDVFRDSAVRFTALPVTVSGFENAGGGWTPAIVLVGSSVIAYG